MYVSYVETLHMSCSTAYQNFICAVNYVQHAVVYAFLHTV